ncbi:glycosyltransferase [Fodinicola acaciae]|uniref:glycosyltransferase n=1 Tax=Fodinicola acaciae TaxID=2681555 RepID=UPI0013D6EA96|nr:glycosyltransferase [Fodinicola acaciae]
METDDGSLGAAVRLAAGLLAGVGRIEFAGPGRPADIVHTVGDVTTRPASAHRVYTVERVPLRYGRLVADRSWVRRQRRRCGTDSMLLAHGRTAARLVVAARLALGERVHCVPVVSPLYSDTARESASRSQVRDRLGLRPGVRLVVCASGPDDDWCAAIERLDRPDVMVLPLRDEPLAGLLTAADLFVATGRDLLACNPAAAALAMNVPVVAVTTDSAADLVIPGRNGYVVPPRPAAVAHAVGAHLDASPGRTTVVRGDQARRELRRLARGLLRVYEQVLTSSIGGRRGGRG